MRTRSSVLAGFVSVVSIALMVTGLMLTVMSAPADATCNGDTQCSVGCIDNTPPCPATQNRVSTCSTGESVCNTCSCTAVNNNKSCSCR
jgi:hypothetical protein